MKTLSTSIFLLLVSSLLLAQNQGNIWYFGDQAGLDFNTTPPTVLLDGQTDFHPPLGWNEGSTSIADNNGTLLFYSNGKKVWDANGEVMPNGSNLAGHSSSTQSSLIIPQPNSEQLFYLFTLDAWEDDFQDGLSYSIIDLCLNEGKGDVMPNAKNIPLYANTAEKLCGVLHDNGTDYWIISREFNTNEYVSFRLTEMGIIDTVVSAVGASDPIGFGGQLVASPNREHLANAIPSIQPTVGKSMLLDFDATTGMVSNEQILSSGGREFGIAFSEDNSKLYFTTIGIGSLFQYDLEAGSLTDIIASKYYILDQSPDQWRHLQLGPNGKIYVSRTGQEYLAIIDAPNEAGASCNYENEAIYLEGQLTSFGLPNFVTAYEYQNTIFEYEIPNLISETNYSICSEENLSIEALFDTTVSPENIAWEDGTIGPNLNIIPSESKDYLLNVSYECDNSIDFTISVEVLLNDYFEIDTLLCEGETFNFAGEEIIAPNNITLNYLNEFDCDSIYQINVTAEVCEEEPIVEEPPVIEEPPSETPPILIENDNQKHIAFPNAFSPNNDGINDLFRPLFSNQEIANYQCQVYDRWGKLIFSANDPQFAWDGSIKGEKAPMGTYVYFCQYNISSTDTTQNYFSQGNITLIR